MKLQLRSKLVASFLGVIAVTGAISTAIGVHLIGTGIVREAQHKVTLDLNSARHIYAEKLKEVQCALEFTALRRYAVREALRSRDQSLLLQALQEGMRKGGLDVLAVTDSEGHVVARPLNPSVLGDSRADDPIVGKVLRHRKSFSGTRIVSRGELMRESSRLADRARIRLIPTPRAKPSAETESTSGMMLQAAIPIFDDGDRFVGVLYGGILLNRSYEIVDETKDVVYRGAQYEGKDVGTATIFQGDLRVSTNVMSEDGSRAIGTRLSSQVHARVIGEGKTWTSRAFVVNDWYLAAYEPIRNIDGQVIGALYVGVLEEEYVHMKRTTFLLLAGVTVAGMMLAFVIACTLAGALARPIEQLKRGAEAIAAGDFDCTVDVKRADEMGSLAESFNRLGQELKLTYAKLEGRADAADEGLRKASEELSEKQKQLVHAEKLASLGALSAGIAHEINNPLATIKLYGQMTLDDLREDQQICRENMEVILKHSTRAGEIVNNLLQFARRTELEMHPVDVNSVLDDVLALTAHQAELQEVDVVKQLAPEVPVIQGDTDKLRQVFLNVVVNALQAMPEGGRLAITSSASSDDRSAQVSITDTGCGISPQDISKIFEPFFTTKELGKGTGLGLSVSHGIIEQHKGRLAVESEAGEGTTFVVTIPAIAEGESP